MTDQLRDIPVDHISPNPRQPRTVFDEAALNELAASIKEHGVIQPLIVVQVGDGYELIAGERRWRASQIAGLALAPCIIKDRVDERTLLEVAVIENVQRVGLSAADEARAYEQLATEFGLSNDEIAQRVGKSRSTIANLRGLLRLPDAVLNQVGPGEGQIPQGIARTLSQVAKFKGAAKDIEQIGARIVKGDLTGFDAEDMIGDLVCEHALAMTADWDLKWLTTPVNVHAADGEIEVRDCFGCSAFVKLNGDRYCAQQPARCYPAKRELYAQREIERVSKATGIPIATSADKATVLQVEYRDQPRVTSWLKAKTRPSHLRLVRVIDQPADKQNYLSTHTIRDILKSREVLLASLDPAALRKAEEVPVKVAEETAAQKAKREAAEEQARAERRAEKGLKRKAQADIDWLGLTAYKAVAPQIAASGATLEWLAGYVNDHSGIGQWPALRFAESEIVKALDKARGAERDRLLKELIVIHAIGHAVASTYDPDWHEDWDGARHKLQRIITDKPDAREAGGLGLKLPAGWDKPPIHRTPSNCWRCGQFASTEKLTKRDIEEGWIAVMRGDVLVDVHCPDCTPRSKRSGVKA